MNPTVILIAVAVAVVPSVAFYLVAPRRLLELLKRAGRRAGRLNRKQVVVAGRAWPYLDGGPTDGTPLVLVHGFGGEKDNWSLYARRLTRDFRVIAPDLPGFGENTREHGLDYGSLAQAQRLRDFLDALGATTCHLGGNSMGGFIALRFAIEFPERVATLTLFDSAGVNGADPSELQADVEKGDNPLLIDSPDDVMRLLRLVVHEPPPFVPKRLRQVVYEDYAEHRDLLDAIFWQIASEASEQPLNDRLPEVAAPTLIVWGRHDRLIDVSCVDTLRAGIPDAHAVVLDDVGHVPMIEDVKGTAAAQRPFLELHARSNVP